MNIHKAMFTGVTRMSSLEICLHNYVNRFLKEYSNLEDKGQLRKLYVNLVTNLFNTHKWKKGFFKKSYKANYERYNIEIRSKNKDKPLERQDGLLPSGQDWDETWKLHCRLPADCDLLPMCRLLLQSQSPLSIAILDGNHRVAELIKVLCCLNDPWPTEVMGVTRKNDFKVVNGRVRLRNPDVFKDIHGKYYNSVQSRCEPLGTINFHLITEEDYFGTQGIFCARAISASVEKAEGNKQSYDFDDATKKVILQILEKCRNKPKSFTAKFANEMVPLLHHPPLTYTIDHHGKVVFDSKETGLAPLLPFLYKPAVLQIVPRELKARKDLMNKFHNFLKSDRPALADNAGEHSKIVGEITYYNAVELHKDSVAQTTFSRSPPRRPLLPHPPTMIKGERMQYLLSYHIYKTL
jgi:hypothetical protein